MVKTCYFYYDKPIAAKMAFNFEILEKLFKKNFREITYKEIKYKKNKNISLKIDFMFFYLSPPKSIGLIQSKLKNIINSRGITDKEKLYLLSYQHNKLKTTSYFGRTYSYNSYDNESASDDEKYKKLFSHKNPLSNIWILKKNLEDSGRGNVVVSNYEMFKNTVSQFKNDFIINKYITNPLLFKDRKFHLRLFYINYINAKQEVKVFLSKYGFIYTAKDVYQNNDFYNPDIHDSHFKKTDDDYVYPNEFIKTFGIENTKKVNAKILEIFIYISKIQNVSNYPDTENGFCIHGIDFMVTDDYSVKLLEINDRTGLAIKTKPVRDFFSNYLSKNIYNEIVCDVFNVEKYPINEKFIKL
jgi:hypothetical protein